MTQTLGVHSEVGQLRQAMVHRPGLELSRLTPGNCRELLFDDGLGAAKAREEHDAFTQLLTGHGVQVTIDRARAFVLDRVCTPEQVGPTLLGPLRELLESADPVAWPNC